MRTTPAETERNNQIIINAAIKTFSEKGYDATTMADIAVEAGVSRGPLYYRYKTKKDVFCAVVREFLHRELEEYSRILSQDKHILEIFSEDLAYYTRSGQYRGKNLPLDTAIPLEMEDVIAEALDVTKEIFVLKTNSVKRAIAKGELRKETDPERVANLIYVFAMGLRPQGTGGRLPYTEEEVNEAVEDILYLIRSKYCL